MPILKPHEAEKSFDSFAPHYHRAYQYHIPDVKRFIQIVDLKPGDNVLDLGCGTAWVAEAAKKDIGDGRVVGIDISTRMLDYGSRYPKNLKNTGMSGQIELIKGDITSAATAAPFTPSDKWKGFDKILALWVFGNLDASTPQVQSLLLWSQCLSPGGSIIVNRFHDQEDTASYEIHQINPPALREAGSNARCSSIK